MNLPKPECKVGYTRDQLVQIFSASELTNFDAWMYGQTMAICEGKLYNHETRSYEVACNGVSHGPIVYPWDLQRFLKGLPVID